MLIFKTGSFISLELPDFDWLARQPWVDLPVSASPKLGFQACAVLHGFWGQTGHVVTD